MFEKMINRLLKETLWNERQTAERMLADRQAVAAFMAASGSMVNAPSPGPDHFVSYTYPTAFWRGWGVNLGDYVQTLATENAVRTALGGDVRFEAVRRDRLVWHAGGTCVMQGWYENGTLDFLPGPHTDAIWIGTHFCESIRGRLAKLWQEDTSSIPYEIGCRDLSTLEFCRIMGVNAYFSRCLTLTLPRRDPSIVGEKVFCVDCPDWLVGALPADLVRESVSVTQRMYRPQPGEDPRRTAESLLSRYRKEAKLVVTTALHCAQPCVAMGIPVVLVDAGCGGADRFSALKGLLRVHTRPDVECGKVDYEPETLEIEPLKQMLLRNLQLSLRRSLTREEELEREQIRQKIASFSVVGNPLSRNDDCVGQFAE